MCCLLAAEKRFSKCLIFRKTAFFWNTSVDQQSQYTIRNLISKVAPNWLTNVKVMDLTFFWDRPFSFCKRGRNCRPNLSFDHLKMIKLCSFTLFLSHLFHIFIVNN